MAIPIITVSSRAEDIQLGVKVAQANDLPHHNAVDRASIKDLLMDFPQAIIFWDADHSQALTEHHPTSIKSLAQIFSEDSKPQNIFAITNKPLNQNQELSALGSFGHHLFRRYEDPTTEILSRLLGAALISHPFGIERYMPPDSQTRTIPIKESSHKSVAVQALQNVLEKNGIPERLSALVAQSTDELILNSVFDAPVGADGRPTRKTLDRSANYVFTQKEEIELTIASGEQYFCVCVADQFGTLKKETVLSFIRQNFKDSEYHPDSKKGSGLGLNGVIQSGLSLLFISHPGVRTEVMLFSPRVGNYRDFRKGFRFLSLLSE